MPRIRRWLGLALLVCVALVPAAARAQEQISGQALRDVEALLAEKAGRGPVQRRIDSQLLAAQRMRRGVPVAPGLARLPGVWGRVRLLAGDQVQVDIRAQVSPELLAALAQRGAVVESAFAKYGAIRARIPLLAVEEVAALPGVVFVEPAHEAITNSGVVTSQGDAAHRAPEARLAGLTGAGIKVGVLSDGATSIATSVASGDLPAGVTVLPGQGHSGDEGTAMLEIVHDLAPSASLYFATAFNSAASFASNITALQAAGCKVIVDDVTYFNEGAFQDGPIAQAVNAVTAAGVLYFSSAANSGNLTRGTSGTWEGDFVDSGVPISYSRSAGAPVHLFAAGEISDPLTLNSSFISLKWSDPLGASTNDYDLFLFDSTLTTLLASSINTQSGTQDPFEFLSAGSGSSFPSGSRLVVARFAGATRALRLDTNRGRLGIATAGSTYGHNAAEKAITVASTDGRIPGPGNPFVGGATNPIQTYSSDGPRRVFYNPDGTSLTAGNVLFGTNGGKLLQKPDLTAADCVSTTVAGFTTFCGTSAAAPHAAAIAALLLSAPSAPSPALVRATLGATALDNMAIGLDRDSGYGIAMADRAAAGSDLAIAIAGPASVSVGANAVYTISVVNNGIGSASSVQVLDSTPAGLVFVSNTGDCATAFPCSLGTLAAGATRTITTTVAVPLSYTGVNPVLNTASVSTSTIDPVTDNNSSLATTNVVAATFADTAVQASGPVYAARGSNISFTRVVTNNGPGSALSVRVASATPAGLTFVSNSGVCTTNFPCSLGTLANGAQGIITTTYAVPVDYPAPAAIVTAATVTSGSIEVDATNNSATVTSRFGAFFTLVPCRLADTRDAASLNGPPALQPGQDRTFVLSGGCGVPAGATAVAVNVTVTEGSALGDLRLYPADLALPLVSTINFAAGQTRANNAIVPASADGSVAITVHNDSSGPVHFILDVTGYFE